MKPVLLTSVVTMLAASLVHFESPPNPRTFSIAGQSGYAQILESNGRAYIDIQDLAHLTGGSLTFEGDRIVLTLPAHSPQPPTVTRGFSKEFLQAVIEQMNDIREWRITIANSVQYNSPISELGVGELQARAQKTLALAGTARSTDDDRSFYQLLAAEYANMQKLSDRFLSMRKQLKYIDPGSMSKDRLDRQILACAHSLASMVADNQYRFEAQCTEAR